MDVPQIMSGLVKNQGQDLLAAFQNHCSGQRVDTQIALLDLIRQAHLQFHVTAVQKSVCSLLEYADAGKAVASFDGHDETFHADARWSPVGNRLEKKQHPGTIHDDHRFARYHYNWDEKDYLVYYVTWEDIFKGKTKEFYVLSLRSKSNISNGHCQETEALLTACGKWTSQLHKEIFVFDGGYWEKSKDLWNAVQGSSWDDVILNPEMKKNLIEDVQGFFDSQALYDTFTVPWKRGIILHGVPGNGKTVSIKALINSLYARPESIPSLYVKTFENFNGEQVSIKLIFQQARKSAPCLLIFEDLDSFLTDEVRSYFLNEVDGLESNDGILMIGSTNHLDRLDPAISKRPSRFDRKYHFKLPDESEREAYANYWRKKLVQNKTVEFHEEVSLYIAKLTEGFSFAYLKELFVMALLTIARGVKLEDLELAQDEAETEAEAEAQSEKSLEVVSKETVKDVSPDGKEDVKTEDATDGSEEKDQKADEGEEKETKPKKEKIKMPEVEIPDHIANNFLLKVIKHNIRILISDMDNTEDDSDDSSGKGKKAKGMPNYRGAAQLAMLRKGKKCC